MKPEPLGELHAPKEECPLCGDQKIGAIKMQRFPYGVKDPVTLFANVPLFSCYPCKFEWMGIEGEQARAEAVCQHINKQA